MTQMMAGHAILYFCNNTERVRDICQKSPYFSRHVKASKTAESVPLYALKVCFLLLRI